MDLYINDIIEQGFVDAASIRARLAELKEGEDIVLHINSGGGDVNEGWAIYDLLRQQEGHTIRSIVEGICASMAVVLHCTAPKENRKALTDASFLLHDPEACWLHGDMYERLTAANLAKLGESVEKQRAELQRETEKIASVLAERTGQELAHITEVMAEEKWLNATDAQALGLIADIEPHKTAQIVKPNNSQKQMKIKSLKSAVKNGARNFLQTIRDLVLKNTEGVEVEIDVEDDGEIAVGVGARPDGTHIFEDGRTIVVEDGVITAIENEQGSEEPPTAEEVAALQQRIAELEQEVETLRAAQRTEEEIEIVDFVRAQGGLQRVKTACIVSKMSKAAPQNPKTVNVSKGVHSDFVEGRATSFKSLREKIGK